MDKLRIAIAGIRGLPSTYSGYETFIEELAPRLAERGHEVTVYCRKALFTERAPFYKGMKMIYLPSIEHKMFSTLSHSLLSIGHASFTRDFDILLVVNAANGMFGFIPRMMGLKSVINVDGMEWLRPKWNALGKFVFKNSARLGTWFYNEVVTDADEMHRLYAREFGIDSTYIAYGANIETSADPSVISKYGLKSGEYYLIASRLVPDNNADLIVDAFVKSGSPKILAIAGGADYKGNTVESVFLNKLKALGNERVRFLGHVNSKEDVKELHCHCFAYLHGHQFGGINPSLLKALGYGNLICALNTPFNAEVLDRGTYGILFERNPESLCGILQRIETNTEEAENFRRNAPNQIRKRFTWDHITDQYELLFESVISGQGKKFEPPSNDEPKEGQGNACLKVQKKDENTFVDHVDSAARLSVPFIRLMGVSINALTVMELHEVIKQCIIRRRKAIVANVNIHAMNIAFEKKWFLDFINSSQLVFCDGYGVQVAARIMGLRLPEKITYADWFPVFCEFCAANGFSVYFLGGEPGVAELARERLTEKIPTLIISGCRHGYYYKERDSKENRDVIADINRCAPDVLLTSFGMPLQEHWLMENWHDLNVRIALTGGGCLDYMSGKKKRPPRWMTDHGFEWLGRLCFEPRRLWKRYLIGNPLFFFRLFRWMGSKNTHA